MDRSHDVPYPSPTPVSTSNGVQHNLVTGWNLVSSPVTNESDMVWSLFHVLTAIDGANMSSTSITVENFTGPGNFAYPGGGAFVANYPVLPGRGIWVNVAAPLSAFVYRNLTAGPLSPGES